MTTIRELFLLDPDVVFLNHGSFGATPLPVFEVYQAWQRRLERQPVKFLIRELTDRLRVARRALGEYLHADADDVVFVANATVGVNIVARSLTLEAGDEVLTSDHEYGACDNAWESVCGKTGAFYLHQPIPLPVRSAEEIADQFWHGVTPRTRIIFLSHITSPTALRLPVETICRRARQAGILTCVDGAHAPGQIPLDMEAVGADFYAGNCHKWLMAPKGAGFLYTRRDRQSLIESLVVSWGWKDDGLFISGSRYVDRLEWSGTRDPAAALSVPAAIQFQTEHDWGSVRAGCRELAHQALLRIHELTGLPALYPPDAGFYQQMVTAPLPPIVDLPGFQARLCDEYRIEVPCISWQHHQFVRISVQGYNTQEDIDALLQALERLLPHATG